MATERPPQHRLPLHPLRVLHYSSDGKRLAFVQVSHPDGKRIVGVITVWDVEQSRVVSPSKYEDQRIISFRLNRDGSVLAVGTTKGEIYIVDANTGERLRTIDNPSTAVHLRFTPDGNKLVAGLYLLDPKTSPNFVWDWRTGESIEEFAPNHLKSVSFSPDGRFEIARGSIGQQLIDHTIKPSKFIPLPPAITLPPRTDFPNVPPPRPAK